MNPGSSTYVRRFKQLPFSIRLASIVVVGALLVLVGEYVGSILGRLLFKLTH
jgi:hypothetical protein